MKKFLLGSTALAIGLSFSAAQAALVEKTPRLVLSGETSGNVYVFKNARREENGGRGNGHHMAVEDSRLNFDVMGKADGLGGLEYSFLIGLSGNTEKGNNPVEENRIKLKGEWGTFFIGNTRGVEDRMAVGAFSVMGATGGFDGNYKHVVNESTGVVLTTDLAGTSKDATKITYATPRVNGVQFGFSFSPNTEHRGEGVVKTNGSQESKKAPFDKNHVALGLNYKDTYANGMSLQLSATAVFGQTQAVNRPNTAAGGFPPVTDASSFATAFSRGRRDDTKAYALGAVFGYKDWQFGVEYMDNHRSREISSLIGNNAGKVFSVAGSYAYGVDTFSAGYFHSRRDLGTYTVNGETVDTSSKANVYAITWDRKLAPGLSVYAEGILFDLHTSDTMVGFQNAVKENSDAGSGQPEGVSSNRGHVFIFGTKVQF